MKKLVGAALVVLIVVVAWFAWHRHPSTTLDRPEGRAGSGAIVAGTKDYEVAYGQRVDLGVIEIVPPRTGEAGTFGMSTEPGTEGLSITQLKEGGPAAAAGLVVGDVITSLAGQPIKTKQPLVQTYLSSGSIGVGVTVQLGLARGTTVAVTSVKW